MRGVQASTWALPCKDTNGGSSSIWLSLGVLGVKVGPAGVGATFMGALVLGETVAGAEKWLSGVTVALSLQGHQLVGVPSLGMTLGVPGVKVGPSELGATVRTPMVGVPVSGLTLGVSGVKVGPAVVGALAIGKTVTEAEERLPGVTVGFYLKGNYPAEIVRKDRQTDSARA
jgi:hypothetical protein